MTKGSRILLLGGSGQLGTALIREIESRGLALLAPPRGELDLEAVDRLAAGVEAYAPAAVVNAAAYNDVTAAEHTPGTERAYRVNRDGPGALARVCGERRIPLIHVSTDYVFDGRLDRPYREDDAAAPLQVYGRSKLEGERAVQDAHGDALIVRTSTVFGRSSRGGSNYVDAILRQARAAESVEVVRLPVAAPTYAPDLARALLDLLHVRARGLVHATNAGECSRLELARESLRLAGLTHRVDLRERPEATDGPSRPAYSVLDTSRLFELLRRPLRPWQEALREHIESRKG